jgi:hypothetical protein
VEDVCVEDVDNEVNEEGDIEGDNTELNQGVTDGDAGDVDDDDNALENTQELRNLRPSCARDYSYRFGHGRDETGVQLLQDAVNCMHVDSSRFNGYVFGHVMTQMTATAGIKKHGQKAIDALFQEFAQLEDKKVFQPLNATTLSVTEKRGALRAINLIAEKRCGKMKGRTCADGRPQ